MGRTASTGVISSSSLAPAMNVGPAALRGAQLPGWSSGMLVHKEQLEIRACIADVTCAHLGKPDVTGSDPETTNYAGFCEVSPAVAPARVEDV